MGLCILFFNSKYLGHDINCFYKSYLAQISFYKTFYSGIPSRARSRNPSTLQTWQRLSKYVLEKNPLFGRIAWKCWQIFVLACSLGIPYYPFEHPLLLINLKCKLIRSIQQLKRYQQIHPSFLSAFYITNFMEWLRKAPVSLLVISAQVLGCILSCYPKMSHMLILKAIAMAR